MCGFAGELCLSGGKADLDAVARMSAAMVHRGPDGCGMWSHGSLALAHRRLTIIDLSCSGHQPMVDSELGLSIVFNGCIYNYRELRAELEASGYRFFSTSDTEVIIKAYHCWGVHCIDRFLGMFAFVIAEHETQRLIMARDRLGIKPLYLARTSTCLRFASTLPALVGAGGVDTSIDRVALHHYLTFHSVVPAPYTILSGVRKLPPATVRIVDPDGRAMDRVYWEPSFTRPARPMSPGEWQEMLLERLKIAVERRMIADVPIGVLLSGGLDSSLIVALLAQSGQHRLTTFSIGFETAGGESGDEFVYSDLVAAAFGTAHNQIRIPDKRLPSAVDRAIRHMSEPMDSHDAVAFFLLSEEVAKHVKVVQMGQGADEVFAGYHWYPPLANVPRGKAVAAYASTFFDQSHAELAEILEPAYLVDTDVSRELVATHFERAGADTTLDAALRLDTTIMLVDDPVKRVDNMAMAWGLEGRVPFLDHELVELAARCPPELKLAGGGKGVLKNVARALLPPKVIDRPKGYFPVPAIRHLAGPLLDRVKDALTNDSARSRGLFREEYVKKLVDAPNESRTALGSNVLWQMGLLELWLQMSEVG